MVVATYRIHSEANHVNVMTTEIEGHRVPSAFS
jgi:hypothetical protein